ncbi:MAG: CotH kinase family protein [Planctomycetes bacterium]|nr:CotH kinase family protein [Planctomycetota bacterium]
MFLPTTPLISTLRFLMSALLFTGLLASYAPAQVVVNEYTASNVDQLRDEVGETPDWIELYNSGAVPVNLTGWGLSDDPVEPFKWTFPPCGILPGQYLVVHASGTDQGAIINERITVSGIGDTWRYLEPLTEPAASWREPSYDDSNWSLGPAGFGRGDGDDQTQIQGNTVFLRKNFVLSQGLIDSIATLDFHVDYDDGFVLFLNGVEIDRDNMGPRFSLPAFDATATAKHEARLYQSQPIDGVRLDRPQDYLVAGKNTVAIQIHNHATDTMDLSAIPFITIGRFSANPNNSTAPGLNFEEPELHANFKLSSMGDNIVLSKADGTLLEHVQTGRMYANVSRGRHPAGTPGQYYFLYGTPGAENTTWAETSFAEPVEVTPDTGYVTGPVTVSMTHNSPTSEIRYTLDGGDPTFTSTLYTGPFTAPGPIGIVRARAFEIGQWPSFPTTNTYMDGFSSQVPVFSLVTDPPNLWDHYTGIYAKGPDAWPFWPYLGANFYKPWERPVHVEMIEPDGSVPLKMDGGIMIHGGASRSYEQKSLRILARGGYGPDRMDYRMLKDRGYDSMKRIILRNGGTDWSKAIMRDGLANAIASALDLETTHYRPAIVLLNGEYWGIQNLRDRQDKFYLEDKFGVDPANIDLIELNRNVTEGDSDHYDLMLEFIRENPMSDPQNYAHVQTLMDTANFATYNAVEIFCANTDWPQNNIKYWRPRTPEGRWRWLLYDLDFGFGGNTGVNNNTLNHAMKGGGWDTFLFRELMTNAEFKQDFTNGYADIMNTVFAPDNMLDILTGFAAQMDPEIDRHFNRWSGTRTKWESNLQTMGAFINQRHGHARGHVVSELGFAGEYQLDLDVQPAGAGYLKMTTIDVSDPFTGIYFLANPVKMTAVAAPGYAFDSWSDPLLPNTESVSLDPIGNYALTCNFVQVGDAAVINEINYKSTADFDPGDWVEIHNNSDQLLDVSSWQLLDEGNSFTIPLGTTIPARGYLVLCKSLLDFQTQFPGVTNAIGDLGFGLNGSGEHIQLLNSVGVLMDEVEYTDQPAWPIPPAGQGPTLELFQPGLDNANPRNWRSSADEHGTPGAENSVRS